ncbi:A24 family peptidase [Kitasatospora sp. NPDC093679]|uniref:A24 family peptidase n=1 Tax=Kitasatospora sp. NPDC093679 TaxID=3154983 RepID=UPI003447F047
MSLSPTDTALAAAAGLAAGVLLVRPAVFAYSVQTGSRTTCPDCGRPLLRGRAAADLLLRRRCSSCSTNGRSARLGPPALVPEVLTALAIGGCVAGGATGWLLAAQLWLAVVGTALLLIDVAVKRLPDRLTGAAAAGVAVLLTAAAVTGGQWAALGRAAAAAGVVGVVFLVLVLTGGMGLGDAKLAPTLAGMLAWHSWPAVFWGICAGLLLGAAHAALLIVSGHAGRKTELAFGPSLLVGAVAVSVLLG